MTSKPTLNQEDDSAQTKPLTPPEETKRFLELTGQPFLSKPFAHAELVEAVRRIAEKLR